MHPSDEPSSAACSSLQFPLYFSFRPSSACCTGCVGKPTRWKGKPFEVLVRIMVENDIREIGTRGNSPSDHPVGAQRSAPHWLIGLIVAAIFVGVFTFGIRSRVTAQAKLRTVTRQMAVPSVSVVHPKQAAPAQEVILPGNIQPFISSPIYARTDGYLKKWYFDIGAH